MSKYNYKGSLINLLFKATEMFPEMTMGEIIYSFTNKKAIKKNCVEASDEELYTALEEFIESQEEDMPFDEQGFNFWVQKQIVRE